MTIEYDSLPALWASLVDALSGRESVILDPPQPTSNWPPDGTSYAEAVISGSDVILTIGTPTGSEDLVCPSPEPTLAGLRNCTTDARWRRIQVFSFGSNVYTSGSGWHHAHRCRVALEYAIWGGLQFDMDTQPSFHLFGPNYNLHFSVLWTSVSANEVTVSAGPVAGTSTLDSVIDIVVDITPCVQLIDETPGANWLMTPANPTAQEFLAGLLQYPGSGEILYAGPQITSINQLADALAESAGAAGTLRTHWDRKLVEVTSESTILPPATGTTDNALARLAIGVRTAFGGDFVLNIQRPKAQVAGRRGVVVIG